MYLLEDEGPAPIVPEDFMTVLTEETTAEVSESEDLKVDVPWELCSFDVSIGSPYIMELDEVVVPDEEKDADVQSVPKCVCLTYAGDLMSEHATKLKIFEEKLKRENQNEDITCFFPSMKIPMNAKNARFSQTHFILYARKQGRHDPKTGRRVEEDHQRFRRDSG